MSATIIGSVFMDIKGFSYGPFSATGTNLGNVIYTRGGVCRNVCEDFANQKEPVSFVGMTDNSAIGVSVRNELEKKNVDLTHLITTEGGMGIWMAILDDHGELVGSVSKQPNFAPFEAYLHEKGEEIIAQAENIIFEIDMNERIAEEVLSITERLNKPVYAIVANMDIILRRPDLLKKVSCFICNNIEASRLFGEDLTGLTPEGMLAYLPERARDAGLKSMIVTMGAKGCVYYVTETGEKGHHPAMPADMIDSTGAGDAFFAGTVMALSRGYSIDRAVIVGTKLASATIACAESSCPYIENLFSV